MRRKFPPLRYNRGLNCHKGIVAFLPLISAAFTGCGGRAAPSGVPAAILLFTGTGTSPGDVDAVERILSGNGLAWSAVNSSQLNAMGTSQIQGYRLLIVPGGNFVNIGKSLTSGTTANIRLAVQNGLNYLGICAGRFLCREFPL